MDPRLADPIVQVASKSCLHESGESDSPLRSARFNPHDPGFQNPTRVE
jgi:hypothetical protein